MTTLAPAGYGETAVWCQDGVHAVLLLRLKESEQISVYHVASGTQTAFLDCLPIPKLPRLYDCNDSMYVSCEAHAVLVPESLQAVSLCSLPGLDRLTQLVSPELAGAPTSLIHMGWAAQGTLIAIAWQSADMHVVLTIHSGCNGRLHHVLPLQLHNALDSPAGEVLVRAFRFCPDLPMAAIAWRQGAAHIYVALIDLARGIQTLLKRTPHFPFMG